MKRLLIGIGVTLAVLIAVALVAPSFIDWNDYKETIAGQIENATGRTVTIDGDVSFSVLPSPALSIDGLRISNVPGAATVDFARLKSLDVEVALFPLLTGTIEVTRVVLVEPVIELEVLPDGQRNWVFSEDGDEDEGSGPEVSVERFLMENGTIVFREAGADPQRLEGLTLELSATSLSGPFDVKGDFRLNDVPLELKLNAGRLDATRIPIQADITVVGRQAAVSFSGVGSLGEGTNSLSGDLSLDAAKPGLLADPQNGGKGTGLMQQPLSLKGKVEVDDTRAALNDLDLSLGDIRGKGGFSYGLGEDPSFQLLLNLSAFDLDAVLGGEDSGSGLADTGGDEDPLAVPEGLKGTIEITSAGATWNGGTIRQARLTAAVGDGRLSITSLTALLPGGSDIAVNGATGRDAGGATFGGKLRLGSANPRALMNWLGVDLSDVPADRITQLSLASTVSMTGDQIQLHEIDATLDTTKLTGGIAYALRDRPSFSATLALDRLNLDAYMPPDTDEESDWQEGLAALNDFDARFGLTVGRLIYGDTTIGDVTAKAELVGGDLKIEQLAAGDLGGGAASLTGSARGFGKQLAWDISLDANAAQAGSVLRLAGIEPPSPTAAESPLRLNLKSKGGLESASFGVDGALGATTFNLTGEGKDWDADDSDISLRVDLKNNSWAALTRQFDLADFTPLEGNDGPAALKGTLAGKSGAYRANLGLDVAGGRIAFNGPATVKDGVTNVDFAVTVQSTTTRGFLRGIGVEFNPARETLGAVDISGKVKGNADAITVSGLKAQIGPAALTGAFSYNATGARPRFDLAIEAKKLNLDLFLPPPETGAQVASTPGGERWSREPLDLAWLRDMDGRIAFKADSFQVRRYQFDAPDMVLALNDGMLLLTSFTGYLFGGEAWGSATLNVKSTPTLNIGLRLTKASVTQAMTATMDQQAATGLFDMTGNFAGAGDTELALISSLKGEFALTARDGVIRGFDVGKLNAEVANLLEGVGALEAIRDAKAIYDAYLQQGETPYTLVDAKFDVAKGKAVASKAVAELTGARGTATATLDLPAWTMDMNMQLRLTGDRHAQTPPVGKRIWGPIDDPQDETQTRELTQFVGNKLKNRVLQDVFSGEGTGDTALRRLLGGGQQNQQQGQQPQSQQPQQPQSQQQGDGKVDPLELIFRGIMNQVREDR